MKLDLNGLSPDFLVFPMIRGFMDSTIEPFIDPLIHSLIHGFTDALIE